MTLNLRAGLWVATGYPSRLTVGGMLGVVLTLRMATLLAERIVQVQESPELAEKLSSNGLRRACDFSWSKHVERLVVLAQELVRSERERN
jgi:glycosyltransferase involved in cell wall biosynthesis